VDLAPYLARDKSVKASDYFATSLNAFRVPVDGTPRQIAIPRETHVTLLYYARNALAAAGVKEPITDWTFTDFVDMGLRMTSWSPDPASARWAVHSMTGLGGASGGLATYWSFGAEFFSEDGRQCLIDRPEARQAFEWMLDLVAKHHITPSGDELTAAGLTGFGQTLFVQGRFPMYVSNVNSSPLTLGAEAAALDWDIQSLPQLAGKKRATRLAGNAFGMLKDGQNKNVDLGWELVKYLVGEEGSRRWIDASGLMMSQKKAAEDWARKRGPSKNGAVAFTILDNWARREQTLLKGWSAGMAPINREWTAVTNGKQSIAGMISTAKPEAEAAMERARAS
jgi:ABC-type glycerol-3-phosphate transport system substrate-binding protein